MSIALYLLVFGIVTICSTIWLPKYPLFEILYRFWSLEQSICTKLEGSKHITLAIDKKNQATVWINLAISWIGCFCFMVQYNADPKYCTFTYAILSQDTWLLRAIFGAHEFLFMLHAWSLMTCANALFTVQGVVLSNLIRGMSRSVQLQNKSNGKLIKILFDYKQLMLLTDRYNGCVAYKTVFLHVCGYCQFISDVFLAVQVLRLPHTGIMDIWFYIEDSLASMYMIYRVYDAISLVQPASQEFFASLKAHIVETNTPRKVLIREFKTLKIVSLKLGPCPVTRATVLSAMEILGNYSIMRGIMEINANYRTELRLKSFRKVPGREE